MADNIKIIGNILNTTVKSRYSDEDINLIPSKKINENFGGNGDYIEYFVYDIKGNNLERSYNYIDYKLPSTSSGLTPDVSNPINNTGNIQTTNIGIVSTLSSGTSSLYPIIEIDPISDLQSLGYSSGEFNTVYNLFTNKISNSNERGLFVKEISFDRTEIRLGSTVLSDDVIEKSVLSLIEKINTSTYFVDYLLNFGDNEQYVTVNVALNKATTGYEILFKLYQPLPPKVQLKQTLWVVEEKVQPYIFDINLDKIITPPAVPTLRGPNFDIININQGTISTSYNSFEELISGLQSLKNSSYQQILNLITSQSININVDYNNFDNFVFFGSAYQRSINFFNKVKTIEEYNNEINKFIPYVNTTASLQTTINQYSSSINDIISNFDGYEYYLYFESSSFSYPKSGSVKPYELLSVTSSIVETWYNNLTSSALTYDENNVNNLEYAIPSFIKDDKDNKPYLLFLNMVGHYFDNIWIYIKSIPTINIANNNLDYGISKDIVYQKLLSLGIKLYNTQAGENVDQYLIGANTGSNVFNGDYSVTSSYFNNIPRQDLTAELYKRIYHNLPLLLKTKGTVTGLENLITTFGITGSILNVKEYGGNTKKELIKGYSDDKVRIIDNTVTGSILSSELSLQTFPTYSNEFRDEDSHYIDISFSPQNQIDNYISKSISSNNPTWSLDDYIGDPRQLYLNNYPDLDNQRSLYFQKGTNGYPGFTGSFLDYSGFIRLIRYFDNSLFKMLEDFVPERTSLSTGITINSPVLERNKTAYSIPSLSTCSIYDANYEIVEIKPEYGKLYDNLPKDKKSFFNGELEGTTVDVHQYFIDNNNPYLNPTSSLTPGDLNNFYHSDWNVLLNNVSHSVISSVRRKIEKIEGTTGSIITPSQLQDSYLSLKSYNDSRYEGVKTTSLLYNTYTIGDNSYGKTAAIDHTVAKIGLFTEVVQNKFFQGYNDVSLKYLIDENGELTELNINNNHWEEVQNTFLLGDTLTISQFNNTLYSNQKSTDGIKNIISSGYSYSPLLYMSGTLDSKLYFQNTVNNSSYLALAQSVSSSYYISASGEDIGFPLVGGYVINIYNTETSDQDGVFLPGTLSNFPTYSVSETGQYKVYANMGINMTMASGNSATWSLEMWNGNTLVASSSQAQYFGNRTVNALQLQLINNNPYNVTINYINLLGFSTSVLLKAYGENGYQQTICSRGYPSLPLNVTVNESETSCGTYTVSGSTSPNFSLIIDKGKNNINYYNATAGNKIVFKLRLLNVTNSSFIASIGNNSLEIGSTAVQSGYSFISCSFFDISMDVDNTNTIIFSQNLSSFYNKNYIFTPNPASGSINSLYSSFGDVEYEFVPDKYDTIMITSSDGITNIYTILDVIYEGGLLKITLDKKLSATVLADINAGLCSTTFKNFIILKKVKDETNIILQFNKRSGKTSYGFTIPKNLNSKFLSNINTITKEVKQKLINSQ